EPAPDRPLFPRPRRLRRLRRPAGPPAPGTAGGEPPRHRARGLLAGQHAAPRPGKAPGGARHGERGARRRRATDRALRLSGGPSAARARAQRRSRLVVGRSARRDPHGADPREGRPRSRTGALRVLLGPPTGPGLWRYTPRPWTVDADLLDPEAGQGIARPAEFLVDPTGTVRWVDLTDDFRVRTRPETVLATFDRLAGGR